jgi:hypothetical protein
MEGLHPETIYLLAADVEANVESGIMLLTMEGLHPETIHLLAADVAANVEPGMLLTMEVLLHQETIHLLAVAEEELRTETQIPAYKTCKFTDNNSDTGMHPIL